MFSQKRTYQILTAIVGVSFVIYNYILKSNVSEATDSYIIFPISITLLLFFAFMYIKLDKKSDWKRYFFYALLEHSPLLQTL